MNKSLLNTVTIKFKNTMFSTSIKLTLVIGIILSSILSFYPFLSKQIIGDQNLRIVTNLNPSFFQTLKVNHVFTNKDDYDLKINYQNKVFKIYIKTQSGYDNKDVIIQSLQQVNLEEFLAKNNISTSYFQNMLNNNISIEDIRDKSKQLDEKTMIFLMYITIIFYIVMIMLISRIGAAVATEKGNKVTEIILTSISKQQLYFSQVISSALVVTITFLAISAPMIIAYFINDLSITSDFKIFSLPKIILFLIHLITVSICLVISTIGFASMTKRIEDANVVSIFSLLPLLVSYLYYVINHDLYRNVFYILNYIPFFSAYPVFGAILSEEVSYLNIGIICAVNIIFMFITFYFSRKIYCNNISSD